jgi:putative ABC transport system substrate-binding protein
MRYRTLALALAVLVSAVAVEAQPVPKVHQIGVLLYFGAPPGLLGAFRAGLHDLGYLDGKNLVIEMRDAAGKSDRLAALADELVRLRVDLILAVNTPAAQAAKRATATIPIVIVRVTDPVRSGLVSSLARPGGNLTGLSFNNSELAIKGLQLLRDVLPGIARVGVLSNAGNPAHAPQVVAMEPAAAGLGLALHSVLVRGSSDLPAAFQALARARAEALFVLDDTALTKQRDHIVKLAAAHSLPIVSRYKDFAEAGGLIAYGPSLPALYRRAAHYADRILTGARPSDLPLEEPSQFDLVINLKTAKTLGVSIPPSVRLTATHVIE